MKPNYPYELPALPFAYDALEPVISKLTLEFHHDKHFLAYINNLNDAISKDESLQSKDLVDILTNLKEINSPVATAVRNNGGGVFNHDFYFNALTSPNSSKMSDKFSALIEKNFGSVENFIAEMSVAAVSQFGSGWAWLVEDKDGKLCIVKTANQDTPLENGYNPLLNLDVWEHAYYLDYQNRRPDYVKKYFDIVNWQVVEERLK
ncbi:MAG: superoxide dismutase [Oscillospiraceae bacterium]|nr:superoxide dismutase [Oscillospiraceae bacterium]